MDGDEAKEKYGATDAHVSLHCHGASEVATCGTQSSHIASFHSRVRVYQEVEDSLNAVRTPIAQSLAQGVNKANREDTTRLAELLCQKQPNVYAGLQEKLVADGRENHRMQKEFKGLMANKKRVTVTETRLRESKDRLRRSSQQVGRSQAVVAAMHEAEAFTPQMLGHGRARGGNKEHRDNRYKVLEKPVGQWEFSRQAELRVCVKHMGESGAKFSQSSCKKYSSRCPQKRMHSQSLLRVSQDGCCTVRGC